VPLPDEATRLGALRKTYAPGPLWRVVVFPGLLSLAILVGALASAGSVANLATLGSMLFFALFFAVAAFLLIAWTPLRRRHLRIDLHEGGLVIRGLGAREVVIFEDVGELWYDVEYHQYGQAIITGLRLVEASGVKHQVSIRVEDGVGLLNTVLRRCSEPLMAEARAALREGDTLTFGKVKLDRDGITIGDARAAWSELQLVRLQPGKALFLRGSSLLAWRTVKHDAIPHPTVFLRLVIELSPKVENDESVTKLLR
jgi:hypothetical protein